MARKKMARLTTRELGLVIRLLAEHIEPIGDDRCRYKDGWSDDRIATEINTTFGRVGEDLIADDAVAFRRRELYGPLGVPDDAKVKKYTHVRERVAALEERVQVLEDLLINKK